MSMPLLLQLRSIHQSICLYPTPVSCPPCVSNRILGYQANIDQVDNTLAGLKKAGVIGILRAKNADAGELIY